MTVALPEDAYCYYTSKDTDFSSNFEKVFSQTGLNLENAGEYVLEADFVSNEDASEETVTGARGILEDFAAWVVNVNREASKHFKL